MTQQLLESSGAPENVEDMKGCLIFPDENTAVKAVVRWGEKALCP